MLEDGTFLRDKTRTIAPTDCISRAVTAGGLSYDGHDWISTFSGRLIRSGVGFTRHDTRVHSSNVRSWREPSWACRKRTTAASLSGRWLVAGGSAAIAKVQPWPMEDRCRPSGDHRATEKAGPLAAVGVGFEGAGVCQTSRHCLLSAVFTPGTPKKSPCAFAAS